MQHVLSIILSLAMSVAASPMPAAASPRGLLNLSPVLSPVLNLGGDNQCTGIGISVCDPINVGGEQNNSNGDNTDKDEPQEEEKDDSDGGDSLINIAPVISPDISLGGDNGCLGIGISVCDPINVDGSQNNS